MWVYFLGISIFNFSHLGVFVLYISLMFNKEMSFYMLSAGRQVTSNNSVWERDTCSINGFTETIRLGY